MAVEIGAVLRVIPTFRLGSVSKAQNRYFAEHISSAAQSDGDVVDACLDWVQYIMGALTTLTSQAVTLDLLEVYIYDAGEWLPIGEVSGSWAGTSATERVPSGVSAMLTASKERSGYLDRKYIAGLTEASVNGDEWVSATVTALQNAATRWVAQYDATNGVSLLPVSVNEATGVVRVLVNGDGVARVAYQRRRKPGVGLT